MLQDALFGRICIGLFALACGLGAVPSGHAAILIVDCTSGPFFDIQTAVTAAATGDTVVVHECTTGPYDPFVVSGKDSVHVVAADDTTTSDIGSQRVGVDTLPLSLFEPSVVVEGIPGPSACVVIDNSINVEIKGFFLLDCITHGVLVSGSGFTKVVDNRIQNAAGSGILEGGSRETLITGNTIGVSTLKGIDLQQSSAAFITDNLIGLSGDEGILVTGFNNRVVNNEVRLNGLEGIRDESGFASRIERNESLGNSGTNIVIDVAAFDADVVGNDTGSSLVDLGTGTDLADNT